MYQLSFFVPESHLESVKNALFEQGAGHFNAYDQCCWQVRGEGQFRPLADSRPYLGKPGRLEKVPEYRVEMICQDDRIKEVVQTLLCVHPYEEPAYALTRIMTIADL